MARAGLLLLAIAVGLLAFRFALQDERQHASLLAGENAALQRQVDALARGVKWSEGQHRAMQERLLAARAELATMTARLASQRVQLAHGKREVQRALAAESASRAGAERAKLALAAAERQRDSAIARQRELGAWIDTQAAAVAIVEERLARAEAARLAAEQSLVARDGKLLERVAILDKGLAAASRLLATLDAENAGMASELAEMQQQLEDAAIAQAELETALDAARNHGAALQRRLDEMQE